MPFCVKYGTAHRMIFNGVQIGLDSSTSLTKHSEIVKYFRLIALLDKQGPALLQTHLIHHPSLYPTDKESVQSGDRLPDFGGNYRFEFSHFCHRFQLEFCG